MHCPLNVFQMFKDAESGGDNFFVDSDFRGGILVMFRPTASSDQKASGLQTESSAKYPETNT